MMHLEADYYNIRRFYIIVLSDLIYDGIELVLNIDNLCVTTKRLKQKNT